MDQTHSKPDYAAVSWRPAVLAGLRDTATCMAQPFFWSLLGAAVLVTAWAGPFATFDALPIASRLAYWGFGITVGGLLATTLSFIALRVTRQRGWPWPAGALVAGLLTVPPQWVLVYGLDQVFLPHVAQTLPELLPLVAIPTIVMTMLVNAVVIRVTAVTDAPDAPAATPTATVPRGQAEPSLLLQRLPPHLGRDIVCLRAQDHYLEVVTTTGSVLVLMRLSDAERALTAIPGMRVHRSWWVAFDHVARFSRAEGGGVSLTTSTGHVIPVSRNQREALDAAMASRRSTAA